MPFINSRQIYNYFQSRQSRLLEYLLAHAQKNWSTQEDFFLYENCWH